MRVTAQHWEVFLSICEKHPNLITGKFNGAQGKAEGNMLWATVSTKLNGLGLGEKSIVEWRRAVTDWKSKVKAKASNLRLSATQTGGGPSTTPPLTPLEERLINIMGKRGFEGDEGIHELGVPQGIPSLFAPQTTQPSLIFEEVIEEVINENDLQENNVFEFPSEIPMTDMLKSSNVSITKPSTFHCLTPDKLLMPKRKHNAEEVNQEHDYVMTRTCDENNSYPTSNAKKRVKKASIPRISKNLEDMTSQSIVILKNIDRNINRIANSFEKLTDFLMEQHQQKST